MDRLWTLNRNPSKCQFVDRCSVHVYREKERYIYTARGLSNWLKSIQSIETTHKTDAIVKHRDKQRHYTTTSQERTRFPRIYTISSPLAVKKIHQRQPKLAELWTERKSEQLSGWKSIFNSWGFTPSVTSPPLHVGYVGSRMIFPEKYFIMNDLPSGIAP